ncbi:hypothetical protein AVEN_82-1 [Araneus ventricosus]|uniref:Uncharacterized protein n=1 Tax=Araneus ventricosus TaxID=182803 RepID=A0A4Y2N1L7_ARAVE|nr:hypothetical protein AVEN_82-1 [Araneus ventricosus]
MSRLDESRWKKHGERYATAITDDRGNASRLRSSMHDREQLLFAARVDIDASGNIVHVADNAQRVGMEVESVKETWGYDGLSCLHSVSLSYTLFPVYLEMVRMSGTFPINAGYFLLR